MTDFTAYEPFATKTQKRYIKLLKAGKTYAQIAKKEGKKTKSIQRSIQRLQARAAERGYEPEFDLVNPVASGQHLKGASMLYRSTEAEVAAGAPVLKWIKSTANRDEQIIERMAGFMDVFQDEYGGKSVIVPRTTNSVIKDWLTLYLLGDPHFGMKALKKYTGIQDWDTDVAEAEMKAALTILINDSPNSQEGVLCNLGDLFHADNFKPFTPASGHLLDTDGDMSYTVDCAARVFRFAIDKMLQKHQVVRLINIRGNHDEFSALMFNKLMAAFYENNPRVIVESNENKVTMIQWGKVLLSILHGDRINNRRWYEMVTRDFPAMWGSTLFRFGHKGHIHHNTVEELGGFLAESHNTLAAPDNYHQAAGYGAARSVKSITYSKEFGEVKRDVCGIEYARSLMKG